jgi:hypothetical protein
MHLLRNIARPYTRLNIAADRSHGLDRLDKPHPRRFRLPE